MREQLMAGSFSLMKKMNTSLILNTIREKELISRAEIAKITGLTPATVSNITAELMSNNLILEAERGQSSGGRKPVMLTIHSDGYYIIGAYIGSKNIQFVAANLNSDILYSDSTMIDSSISIIQVIDWITIKTNEWMKENQGKKILGIGVGMHGLVKSSEGISVFGPNLGWENVPVKALLEERLSIPVFLDNDVRTMTLGESWFGVARNVSDFVFIYLGYGVGGSIVLGNQLYKGVTEGAGEIGHTTINTNGPRCSCGNFGCLQVMASEESMVNQARELIEKGRQSSIGEMIKGELSNITPEVIYKAAIAKDSLAMEIIEQKARYLGIGVANTINTFNPPLVVINGNITKLGNVVMEYIKDEVSKRSMKYLQEAAHITFSGLNEEAIIKGTVALVLRETFADPDSANLEASK